MATKFILFIITFISLSITSVISDVLVYKSVSKQLIEEFQDFPALFGSPLPSKGLFVFANEASPRNACTILDPPPRDPGFDVIPIRWVAIISRSNCSFEEKVRNAQTAGYDAAIVYNVNSNDLEHMSAKNGADIRIPSVFVGASTGEAIILSYQYFNRCVLVLNDDTPFNINTHLLIPFSILVVLCFLIMVIFIIVKCVREQNRMRRHRLPGKLLKKIPIIKMAKHHPYETCVICLDDFVEGDKLRVLPCEHAYHCHCIDVWLTKTRRVCPICKRKVFPRGEPRCSRNRRTSDDSQSDSETDDTTPLINADQNPNTATTGHGTFSPAATANSNAARRTDELEGPTSDDEPLRTNDGQRRVNRVNPFDRIPNLPPNLLNEQNSTERNLFGRFTGWFQRQPDRYVLIDDDMLENSTVTDQQTNSIATSSILPAQRPGSNNILNSTTSGSFHSDDEQIDSIYEPITSKNNKQKQQTTVRGGGRGGAGGSDDDVGIVAGGGIISSSAPTSTTILAASRGRIGVAALPNSNLINSNNQNPRNFYIV